MSEVCPSGDLLAAFHDGRLTESEIDHWSPHIESCANCLAVLDAISGPKSPAKTPQTVALSAPSHTKANTALSSQQSLAAFWDAIARSRVLPTDRIASLQNQASAALGSQADVEATALWLVEQGKLTPLQAAAIYQGCGDRLVFGEYLLLDWIGAGGMGQVYKAIHRRMDRQVALKVLAPDLVRGNEAIKRFQREVKAAAKLEHANIVTAYDAGEDRGTHFLIMQYVAGRDLAAMCRSHGRLPLPEAVSYMLQAATGLAYAHGEGVIHRDIKPSNLLVDPKGTLKILDMGLARVENALDLEASQLTDTGQVMGTLDYMAPEQALDTRHADARSDVYSLGCTLYRLLTGEVPYPSDTVVKKILAHREQPVPKLRVLRSEAPEELEALCGRMMAKDPQERPQAMTEVVASLQHVAAQLPPPSPPASVSSTETAKDTQRLGLNSPLPFSSQQMSTVDRAETRSHALGSEETANQRNATKETKPVRGWVIGGASALVLLTALFWGREWIRRPESREVPSAGTQAVIPAEAVSQPAVAPLAAESGQSPVTAAPPLDPDREFSEPPSLEEWLQGRERRTVARDGSGEFQTIGAALTALQPGQVVEILDRGPYFENLKVKLPADSGLVSQIGTIIDAPAQLFSSDLWFRALAHELTAEQGFRLSGISFVIRDDEGYAKGLSLYGSDLVIENCVVAFGGPKRPNRRSLHFHHRVTGQRQTLRDCLLADDVWIEHQSPGDSILRRNCLSPGNFLIHHSSPASAPGGRFDVSHNLVLGYVSYGGLAGAPAIDKFRLADNTIVAVIEGFETNEFGLARRTEVNDNLFVGGCGIRRKLKPGDDGSSWFVARNGYIDGPEPGRALLPLSETDVQVKATVFERSPERPDFGRYESSSALALGGRDADGEPTYLGAAAPSPAPEAGDWLTAVMLRSQALDEYLRSSSGDVKGAGLPLVSSSIPSAPLMAQWINNGRNMITVAQNGSRDYKTIGEALAAVKPGQVIQVADHGPYRENLHLRGLPVDIGLVSTSNTIIEAEPVIEMDDGTYRRAAHFLSSTGALRISGFTFLFRDEQGGSKGLSLGCPDVVVENCSFRYLGPERPDRREFELNTYNSNQHSEIRNCIFSGYGYVINRSGSVAVRRNFFGPNSFFGLLFQQQLEAASAATAVEQNVFASKQNMNIGMQGSFQSAKASLVNNTYFGHETTASFNDTIAPHETTIQNNLFACGGGVVVKQLLASDPPFPLKDWKVAYNVYLGKLGTDELPELHPEHYLPAAATDLLQQSPFDKDVESPNFARFPADSPLAGAGRSGEKSVFIGALPPAAPDRARDWFDNLVARYRALAAFE